ncbi:PREDICTED: DNA ligase 1 [Tarenaya hassleriana]|uniref:DNA ligase 1 n=1 Tax=Tarenaya hassleriana TaxID=28532 RepID=UPI00053C08E7|nr:PREDICTED: DNA ligase 1 [Tarenaya hassleriana]
MSRTFPCPPSGYERSWANGQDLVDSTKIKIDTVNPIKELWKQKEKKEKRRDKKEKREKSKKALEQRAAKFDNNPEPLYSKKIQDESRQLEKSDLTEEHELPQSLCYLSDESQSSNKRKRQDWPAVESNVKAVPGKPLRIRFVFRKPNKPESVPQEERVCSTSVAQDADTSFVANARTSLQEENLPSTSRGEEGTTIPIGMRKKERKRSKESRYHALFEGWVPSAPSSTALDVDYDHQDWLFCSRKQERPKAGAGKMDKDLNSLRCLGDPSWSRALFLPEVGIYSLPYTIPL